MELVVLYLLVGLVVAAVSRAQRGGAPWDWVEWAALWPFFAPLIFVDDRPPTPRRPDLPDALAEEHARIEAFVAVLDDAEARMRAMDALLASPPFDAARIDATLAELSARGVPDPDPRVRSVRARREDAARLRAVHAQAAADLEHARLKLEEVRARVHLFAVAGGDGRTASLAEAISGLDEVGVIVNALSNAWRPAQGRVAA